MRRRVLLRSAGATLVAVSTTGCLFGVGGRGKGVGVEPVESFASFAAIQSTEFSAAQEDFVNHALGGEAYVTYGYRPFPDGTYIEVDDRFYKVGVNKTGTEQLTRTVLGADQVSDDAAGAVDVHAYPEADQEPVVYACRLALSRERQETERVEDPHRFVYVLRTRTAENSALLPEPEHPVVRMGDRTFRLWTEERDVTEEEFRSRLTLVAERPAAFRRATEDEFVIDLDAHELSPVQRDMIEEAITNGDYIETGRTSPELDELLTLLREEAPRRDSLIKYEGEYYRWDEWHSD